MKNPKKIIIELEDGENLEFEVKKGDVVSATIERGTKLSVGENNRWERVPSGLETLVIVVTNAELCSELSNIFSKAVRNLIDA